ncbi:hypothetical protein ZIOFF_015059 [Zingiber officinale]|uniref:Uncharacterized protein n=1 Tax=Zingiber officinale TaxID=94328 RepID=A0A8J5LM51_ZINOF|nr:hypothetical protein ZIOFF_015059 [Zingiber officinale]
MKLPNAEKAMARGNWTPDDDVSESMPIIYDSEHSRSYNNGVGSITTLGVLAYYDLCTIKAATNDFSDENKPGEGGIGVVYNVGFQVSTNKLLIFPNLQISNVRLCQGELQDGQKIAVKKLSRYSLQGSNE